MFCPPLSPLESPGTNASLGGGEYSRNIHFASKQSISLQNRGEHKGCYDANMPRTFHIIFCLSTLGHVAFPCFNHRGLTNLCLFVTRLCLLLKVYP